MLDWKQAESYQFTSQLSREEWAWEFLRRNPTYRSQWREFRQTWLALEADYGKAPNRDFCAWKLDPRAWRPAAECPEGDCRIDEDKVLIECALGASWGFYKYPPDPADDRAIAENRLVWRDPNEQPQAVEVSPADTDYLGQSPARLALGFDLSLPLKPQLETAKRHLQLQQKARTRQGLVKRQSIAAARDYLTICLRVSDALQSGANQQELQQYFADVDMGKVRADVQAYLDNGYLRLLQLPK